MFMSEKRVREIVREEARNIILEIDQQRRKDIVMMVADIMDGICNSEAWLVDSDRMVRWWWLDELQALVGDNVSKMRRMLIHLSKREYESSIKDKVDAYVEGEAFIDHIISRINRKQLDIRPQ